MKRSLLLYLLGIFFLGILTVMGTNSLREYAALSLLHDAVNESEGFRNQWLSEEVSQELDTFCGEQGVSRGDLLTVLMLDHRFDLTGVDLKDYGKEQYSDSLNRQWGRKP